jgi:hypothetical protein
MLSLTRYKQGCLAHAGGESLKRDLVASADALRRGFNRLRGGANSPVVLSRAEYLAGFRGKVERDFLAGVVAPRLLAGHISG